ncbi:MAG: acyl-ACP--UDP-N-acetylglucosamine O-acyltransferase [Pirellulaceae bacterium]
MEHSIHPTAVIDPRATLGRQVSIGPFCVVEAGSIVGDGCRLASRVVVKEGTTLGDRNDVDEGTVLGGRPQHVARHPQWGKLVIGTGNMIRENVTIHRAMSPDQSTVVGDDNLIMVNAHIAHDCHVGNHTILTNNVMLAGHVSVDDYAYLSGGVGVHQFCRIGSHCMVGGQSHINKDVPPYVTVDGVSTRVVGLNVIGLKRRGFTADEIQQLKEAYRIIYRQGLMWEQVLEQLRTTFVSGPATNFYAFFRDGRRGFVLERRTPAEATIPLPQLKVAPAVVTTAAAQRKVG